MPENESDKKPERPEKNENHKGGEYKEKPPVDSEHSLQLPNRELHYTARAGMLPLRGKDEQVKAEMFYVSYTLKGEHDLSQRPLIIAFNGGPGSSSVWLHLGALGPYRAAMEDEGWLPAPPYRLEANAATWLDFADLLFIDPVGTGYSRATEPEKNKEYWGLDADLESMSEFIRLYLARTGRWASPLYLCGESYGTTRAAGLAGKLTPMGVGLSGVILISSILNYQTCYYDPGNDLPPVLFLPTYAATAWYHGRLAPELQARPLPDLLAEVEGWALGEYASALMQGDALPVAARSRIAKRLARYIGLDPRYVDLGELRVNIHRFCKELRRSERRVVGRLDSRFEGIDSNHLGETVEIDPSMSAIMFPYTTLMNHYVRGSLGYESDRSYEVLSSEVNQKWVWPPRRYPNTGDGLRTAMHQNRHLRVFVAQGYYDLATPYFAAQYTMTHLGLDASLRDNIRFSYYEAGHMMYIQTKSMWQLREDVINWIGQPI